MCDKLKEKYLGNSNLTKKLQHRERSDKRSAKNSMEFLKLMNVCSCADRHWKTKFRSMPLQKLKNICPKEVTQQGDVDRRLRVLFHESLQMRIFGISFRNFVHRKLLLTTVPLAGIELFFQLLLHFARLVYEIRLPHAICTKFPPRKWKCSYRSVEADEKYFERNFQVKKPGFLKRYSLTTSIETLAWGTYLLGLLPAWQNQQPHVYRAI
jgi:hypothetical protein